MIERALYTGGLGGGRPARIDQPAKDDEICNRGIGERPVCMSRQRAAIAPPRFTASKPLAGKNDLERQRIIREQAVMYWSIQTINTSSLTTMEPA